MQVTNEQVRREFSQRLRRELQRLNLPLSSPTQISRAFNARFPAQSVSAQTFRKWLMAEAMPTQVKLVALAEWFEVSAQWLRFGTGARSEDVVFKSHDNYDTLSVTESVGPEYFLLMPLIRQLHSLSPRDLELVKGIVNLMLSETQNDLE